MAPLASVILVRNFVVRKKRKRPALTHNRNQISQKINFIIVVKFTFSLSELWHNTTNIKSDKDADIYYKIHTLQADARTARYIAVTVQPTRRIYNRFFFEFLHFARTK